MAISINKVNELRMKGEIPFSIIGWFSDPVKVDDGKGLPCGATYEARTMLQDSHGIYNAVIQTNDRMKRDFPEDKWYWVVQIEDIAPSNTIKN